MPEGDPNAPHPQQLPPGWPPGWPPPPQGYPPNGTVVDPWAMVAMRSFPSSLSQLMAAGLPPSVILLVGLFMLYGELQGVTKSVDEIKEEMTVLSTTVTGMSATVWTRADQAAYDAKIDARLRALETRGER